MTGAPAVCEAVCLEGLKEKAASLFKGHDSTAKACKLASEWTSNFWCSMDRWDQNNPADWVGL